MDVVLAATDDALALEDRLGAPDAIAAVGVGQEAADLVGDRCLVEAPAFHVDPSDTEGWCHGDAGGSPQG